MKSSESIRATKPPRQILDGLFAFPPNRDILGGTAYFIVEKAGNVLVDCPVWDRENQQFLLQMGGVRWLFLTHRGGIGKPVKQMQVSLDCEVLLQEQEAYLLPDVKVTPFERETRFAPNFCGIWTPGHSPGSACLYWNGCGGVLFCGRHLLSDRQGKATPLRTAKTFHWRRQLRSVELLRDRFNSQTLQYLCPGSNTGFLRGRGAIESAYQHLSQLDLDALARVNASNF